MHQIRRWVLSAVAAVLFATASFVLAQRTLDGTHASDARGARLFAYLVNDASRDLVHDLYSHVRDVLVSGLEQLQLPPAEGTPQTGVCVHLAGTGGTTPRLDGGGDLISALGGGFVGASVSYAFRERITGFRGACR